MELWIVVKRNEVDDQENLKSCRIVVGRWFNSSLPNYIINLRTWYPLDRSTNEHLLTTDSLHMPN